jgi:N-acetylneuraminic acid mutarotase
MKSTFNIRRTNLSRAALLGLSVLAASCAARTPAPVAATSAPVSGSFAQTSILESSTAVMPRAVTSFGAAALDGSVYVFGGYFGTPHAYSSEYQSGELWKLDPSTRQFVLIAHAEPTQGAQLVSSKDALIRVGGMRALNKKGEPERMISLDEVAAYSPREERWTALPSLPAGRSSHAAAVLGNKLYVVGGWQLAGSAQSGTFVDSMLIFDLDAKSYQTVAQPFQRRALAAVPLDGKLVVLGGIGADGKVSRQVDVFDPATNQWSRASDLPVDGFGIAAASKGDVAYASARDGTLYALSAVNEAFAPVSKLALPRFFHQLVVNGDRILALGGISGMHMGPRIRQVESLDVTQPGPSVLSFVLSNPLRGRNRQGVFVHDESLYVFGGNRSLEQHDFAPEDFVSEAARLDIAALTWAPMAPFPVGRQTVQTLVEGDQVLALGGFGHDGTAARAHADAYRYDVEQDRWSPDATKLPTPRTQFGLASANGAWWVFGGLDFKPEAQGEAQFDHPTTVLRATPGTTFAPSGIELRTPRRAFGGALLAGRYYLVGGMAGGFSPVATCESFEIATSSWHDIACPSATRISPQLVALGGKLYLAGGSSANEGGLTPNAKLEVYDPATNSWSTLLEQIPIEPRHLTMLPYGDALLLYSAHDEQGRAHLAIIRP